MPNFSDQAPKTDNRHGFRLIRTPASPPLRAYVISEKLVGCSTHFVGNRTIPCEAPKCEPCENGIGWRWHGYLFIQIEATTELCIFEMTAAASDAFQEYAKRHGTLRGCHFQARRANGKGNGRVLVQAKPADLAKIHLPESRDVTKLLCHIWNIAPNQTAPDAAPTRPGAAAIKIDRERPELAPPTGHARDPATHEYVALKMPGNGQPKPPTNPAA